MVNELRAFLFQSRDFTYPPEAIAALNLHWGLVQVWMEYKTGTSLRFDPALHPLIGTWTYDEAKVGLGVDRILREMLDLPVEWRPLGGIGNTFVILTAGLGGHARGLPPVALVGDAVIGPLLERAGYPSLNTCGLFFPPGAWQCRPNTAFGTIIHELTHAAFRLGHTFDPPNVMGQHTDVQLDNIFASGYVSSHIEIIRQSPYVVSIDAAPGDLLGPQQGLRRFLDLLVLFEKRTALIGLGAQAQKDLYERVILPISTPDFKVPVPATPVPTPTIPVFVSVPNVVGLTAFSAEVILTRGALIMRVGTVYSNEPPGGVVISQDPPGGAIAVPIWSTVYVRIRAPVGLVAPNVVGMPESEARSILEGLGLLIRVIRGYNSTVTAGLVVSQVPPAGSPLDLFEILLAVSLGPLPAVLLVPNVVGMPESQALSTLQGLGLTMSVFARDYSDMAVGTVISQEPPAGTEVFSDNLISVIISLGPTPPVILTELSVTYS